MNLYAGYVAVRADEIPYGTRMYITSPDNKFVYGFAIAADTGTALMDNIIDFDLFYETYVESCLNGRKHLNVYILD
jgi:3D (Asp-Asp-Asp) domain-containing protein